MISNDASDLLFRLYPPSCPQQMRQGYPNSSTNVGSSPNSRGSKCLIRIFLGCSPVNGWTTRLSIFMVPWSWDARRPARKTQRHRPMAKNWRRRCFWMSITSVPSSGRSCWMRGMIKGGLLSGRKRWAFRWTPCYAELFSDEITQIDLFSKDVVLIPVNHGNAHWTAAAINFRNKRFESYDSMDRAKEKVFRVRSFEPLVSVQVIYVYFTR